MRNKQTFDSPVAVCYARQSKSDAEDTAAGQSLSSRNQIERCSAYCEYNGFAFDREMSVSCVDLDTSSMARAKDRAKGLRSWQKRPGLARIYAAAQEGRFQHLLCYDIYRLGGDSTELHLIREAFGDMGVTIHAVGQGIRTDQPSGEMIFSVFAGVAHDRLKTISRTFRDALRTRAESGRHLGRPPWWLEELPTYAVTPEQVAVEVSSRGPRGTIGWYRLHPVLADVAREIVARRMRGEAYSGIARALSESSPEFGRTGQAPTATSLGQTASVHSDMASEHLRLGARWSSGMVNQFLRSDSRHKMRGAAIFGRLLPRDDPKRLITPGIFPALLTPAESDGLDLIQETLSWRGFNAGPSSEGNKDIPHRMHQQTTCLCSGLIYCIACGARLRSVSQSPRYWQYICVNAADRKEIPHPTMQGRGGMMCLSRQKVDDAVILGLAHLAANYAPAAMIETARNSRKSLPSRDPGRPKRGIDQIDEMIDSLTDLRATRRITEADFDRRYTALSDERNAVREWQEKQRMETEQGRGLSMLMEAFGESDAQPSPTQMRLILRLLVERIDAPIVLPGMKTCSEATQDMRAVRIHLKCPLDSGTKSILAGLYRDVYKGRKFVTLEGASSSCGDTGDLA